MERCNFAKLLRDRVIVYKAIPGIDRSIDRTCPRATYTWQPICWCTISSFARFLSFLSFCFADSISTYTENLSYRQRETDFISRLFAKARCRESARDSRLHLRIVESLSHSLFARKQSFTLKMGVRDKRRVWGNYQRRDFSARCLSPEIDRKSDVIPHGDWHQDRETYVLIRISRRYILQRAIFT